MYDCREVIVGWSRHDNGTDDGGDDDDDDDDDDDEDDDHDCDDEDDDEDGDENDVPISLKKVPHSTTQLNGNADRERDKHFWCWQFI